MIGWVAAAVKALPQPQGPHHPGLDPQLLLELPAQGLLHSLVEAHPAPGQVVEPAGILLLVVNAQKPAVVHDDSPHPQVEAALGG